MSLKSCCATGSLHTGTPTGRIEKVHGLDCYIAEAPNGQPKGVVVIVPDAFGWTLPNNRILADDYAKNGNFRVYLPEFMDGVHLPADLMTSMKALEAPGLSTIFSKVGHFIYLARHFFPFMFQCRHAITKPRVYGFMKALKNNEAKELPVGAAGFCWGGPFVMEMCHGTVKAENGTPVIDCGFAAHAAVSNFSFEVENIALPFSYAAAEHDMAMSADLAGKVKDALAAKTAKSKDQGVEHEFVMYNGVHHGFAVRADENEKHEAEQGKKAEAQAVAWFSKWFARRSVTPGS